MDLTNVDKLAIAYIYHFESDGMARYAQLRYQDQFPDKICPSENTFKNIFENIENHGSFAKPYTRRQKPVVNEQNVANVVNTVEGQPTISIRAMSNLLHISYSSFQRILKENKFRPYCVNLVQELRPLDFQQRMQFIRTYEELIEAEPDLFERVLWSDESRFMNDGNVNRHNCHFWSVENPHWVRETIRQGRWGINVWCGILGNSVIGPYFYDGNLTGQRYLAFLKFRLPNLLQNVPLEIRNNMWFMQDGAPSHTYGPVVAYLNGAYQNNWMGKKGPINWPARSPDLTPLDYFLWGYIKEKVYVTPAANLEDLKARITAACRGISAEMLQHVCSETMRVRHRFCIEQHGEHFEYLMT